MNVASSKWQPFMFRFRWNGIYVFTKHKRIHPRLASEIFGR